MTVTFEVSDTDKLMALPTCIDLRKGLKPGYLGKTLTVQGKLSTRTLHQ